MKFLHLIVVIVFAQCSFVNCSNVSLEESIKEALKDELYLEEGNMVAMALLKFFPDFKRNIDDELNKRNLSYEGARKELGEEIAQGLKLVKNEE